MGRRLVLACYLLALHVAAGWALLRTSPAVSFATTLGIEHPTVTRNIVRAQSMHRQADAQVPAGAVVFLGDSHVLGLATAAVTGNSVNFGIGGLRSDQLLDAMGSYGSVTRARAVVVMVGTNDIVYRRTEGIEDRYRAILSAVPKGVPVVLTTVPPIEGAEPVADAARRACKVDQRCTLVDLSTLGDADLADDGVHLSPAGYQRWIELLRHALPA